MSATPHGSSVHRLGLFLRQGWHESARPPTGAGGVIRIALAVLLAVPLLALFLVVVLATMAFGLAIVIAGGLWAWIRRVFTGGRDASGRRNVRVVVRQPPA